MKTLYISDLDGTLLDKNAAVSDFTAETINSLIAKGLDFSFATARSLVTSVNITKRINISLPVITNNGTFAEYPKTGKTLIANEFTDDEKQFAASLFSGKSVLPFVYAVIDGKRRTSWALNRTNDRMQGYIDAHSGDKRLRPVKNESGLFLGKAYYFTLIGDYEILAPIREAFLKDSRFTLNFQREIYFDAWWLEIMPKNANKGISLKKVKEKLGFERVVAFGDSVNDMPLFEAADECYAVANAAPEIKKLATGVIESNNDDGVARFLLKNFS